MALRQDEAYDVASATDTVDAPLVAPSRDGTVDVVRDRQLVERCQAGDRSAFDELFLRYQRRLHRFCMQRVGDPNDAEDVVQETFARAWRALPRFAGERRFYPWLTVIAGNLCVDTLRRRSRQTPVEESRLQAADVGTYETEDAILQDVDSKLVAAAFGQLSERHRRVLQLREGNDWSYREIAEHEGVGITAVETLLWRARQALKREFMLLDGQKGRLGSLAGLLTLLRVRILGGVVGLVRHPATALRHALRHLGAGVERTFGTTGAFGVFGPSAAAATGAVVLGMGTILLAPTAPASPTVARPSVVSTAGASSVPAAPVPAPSTGAPPATPVPGTGSVSGTPNGGAAAPTPGGVGSGGAGTSVAGLPPVSGAATPVTGGLGPAVGSAVGGLGSTVGGAASGLGSTVGGAAGGVGSTVNGAVGGLGSTVNGAVGGLGTTVSGAAGGLGSTVNGLTGTLGLPSLGGSGTAPASGATPASGSSSGSGLLGLGG